MAGQVAGIVSERKTAADVIAGMTAEAELLATCSLEKLATVNALRNTQRDLLNTEVVQGSDPCTTHVPTGGSNG